MEFLTDEQVARLGRFADQVPSQAELERFFFLDDADRALVRRHRGEHNRRKICFGHRGELRQAYQEGMEDQLGALGLVLNAVVLWNTTYLDAAVTQRRAQGYPVDDADAAHLSPLSDTHLNVHGAYTFHQPPSAGLRPLRDPDETVETLCS